MVKVSKIKITDIKFLIAFLFFSILTVQVNGQYYNDSLFLLKGILLTEDSLKPLPDAHIISKKMIWGTFSEPDGNFEIYVPENDTLLITSLGFSNGLFFVDDSVLKADSVTIFMKRDTITLNEVLIKAFWDYETFKQMVIDMRLPEEIQINADDEDKLLNRPLQPYPMGPIQALYNLFNSTARLQRKLIRNRKHYNKIMIQMGRVNDTIPTIPEHMQRKQHSP